MQPTHRPARFIALRPLEIEPVELILIEEPSIVLLLDEALNIVRAWRVRRRQRLAPCVARVTGLRATAHGQPTFRDQHFETDGLGCIRLLWWITAERPDASGIANLNRFQGLFCNNPTDAITATLRILTGRETQAAGETAYFICQQWTHHPEEIAALALLGEISRQ